MYMSKNQLLFTYFIHTAEDNTFSTRAIYSENKLDNYNILC